MDVVPIVKVFDALLTAGAAAVEGAKGSLYHALIGLAIVIMCKIIAGLVGGALGAPGGTALGPGFGPVAALVFLT